MPGAGEREGRRINITGVVQGVGFRPWVWRLAHELDVRGRVFNDGQGVIIEAFAARSVLDELTERLQRSAPPAARIQQLSWRDIPVESAADFLIEPSRADNQARRVSIPADIATCDECLAEICDPSARRFGYALTNCTQCGPRYTIAREIPYDRANTTMAAYALCADCRREYQDPTDRRFHAQPIACPTCGPRLQLLDADGKRLGERDPIGRAVECLVSGQILAVKGLGGYHLCCDATSAAAVRTLRGRKRRDEKPFAVMVRDLTWAEELAELGDAERALLTSTERPIVLVPRRPGCRLADEVAPENPLIGVFLAYTPLHHLLLSAAERPLVMTSGNLSEEPIAFDDQDARARLAGLADAWLMHERVIENHCDDSVARVIAGKPVLFRRSRGYVPRVITLPEPVVPVLACGAHLKNTFCLAQGKDAYLGPHIGDLDNLATLAAYERAVARLQRFVGIHPEIIAHDLHPDYQSTHYALARPETRKIAVQHHHAHVVAVMAEHGLPEPVLGIAFDGTGLGSDGTAWGGELLLCHRAHFERLATLRPMPLPGGDLAIRQVWRLALAMLDDAFGAETPLEDLELFRKIPHAQVTVVRQMVAQRLNTPLAHGAGRYFDALGALGLAITESRFEGQVAMRWNFVADASEAGVYDFAIDSSARPWSIDLRPMVRAAAHDLIRGTAAATVSAKFHNTLSAATASATRLAAQGFGRHPVVLTGGCFQNARLAESLLADLGRDFQVYLPSQVPPGDGGLALGQAVVADAIAKMG